MEKYRGGIFNKAKKKKDTAHFYKPTLALYTNIAVNTMQSLIKPYKDTFRPHKALKALCEKIDDVECQDEIIYYVDKFKAIYPFVNHIIHPADTDKDCLKKIYKWVSLLKDIRNKHSHSKYKKLNLDRNIVEEIQDLYDIAIENTRSIKDRDIQVLLKYKDIFEQSEEEYYLTFTGIVFYITLFLRIQDINAFLGLLIQAVVQRDDRGGKIVHDCRQRFKNRHPDSIKPFLGYLQVRNKDFLYKNEVYLHWAIRGFLGSSSDKKVKDQIRFFELMNYLKKCPLERVKIRYKDDVPKEQRTERCLIRERAKKTHAWVVLRNNVYVLRAKNNFINYALDYWEDQLTEQFPDGTEWKWAHFSSEEQRQNNKRKKNFEKLNFQETVIWNKPQEDICNEENEPIFPYYIEANNLFFRLKKDDNYIVGMMSVNVLYDLLRNYFSAEDRTAYIANVFEETWKYVNQYLNYTHTYKKQNPNLAVPNKYSYDKAMSLVQEKGFSEKINVSETLNWSIEKEVDDTTLECKIKQRVIYLKTYYERIKRGTSNAKKVRETIRAWFAILNYGKTKNWAHAFDLEEKDNSIVSQYKHLTYYLSRLGKPNQSLSDEFDNYLSNTGLTELLQKKQPNILHDCHNLNQYFNNAMDYRLEILNHYEELLALPFNRADWKPVESLRWLKIRTPERARKYPKQSPVQTQKVKLQVFPSVLNMEKGVYFAARAVPLPHNFYTKIFDAQKQEERVPIGLVSDFYTVNMKLYKAGHFRKLYSVKQQDMVLSHIAAHYAGKLSTYSYQSLTLANNDFQTIEFSVPYTINSREITVCYYYPYFKQSYYKLSPELLTGLLEAALQYDKIPADGKIYFNSLKPQKDENGRIIFKKINDVSSPTVWSLWQRYNSSRAKFIDNLLTFERKLYKKYNNFPLEITYIPFGYYVHQARKDGIYEILNNINEIRTAALYGEVALHFTRIKDTGGIDFFGAGNDFIKQISDEVQIKKYKENFD